ncbi:VOC family protein [Leifsonia poae]|uniref:VOC family protein n=1 Tax=Leifsonia poae TaxID=110933 RepID=UPI001CBB7F0B|nr:VOC family protein [Leifsonia poae]
MSTTTTTHLNFRGDARAALAFYQSVFGGQATITTYGDLGMPKDAPGAENVVFGGLETAEGFRVMAYDIPDRSDAATADVDPSADPSADPAADPSAETGSTRRENGLTLTDRPFFVSVRGESFAEVQQYWAGLSVGATIVEAFAASAWSTGFGMLTDRFGVTWVLDVAAA